MRFLSKTKWVKIRGIIVLLLWSLFFLWLCWDVFLSYFCKHSPYIFWVCFRIFAMSRFRWNWFPWLFWTVARCTCNRYMVWLIVWGCVKGSQYHNFLWLFLPRSKKFKIPFDKFVTFHCTRHSNYQHTGNFEPSLN